MVLFGPPKMLNELHFPYNELFIFYMTGFQLLAKRKMKSKIYGIPW